MPSCKSRLLLSLLLLFVFSTQATAQNLRFLRNSTISSMTKEDRVMLRQAIDAALAEPDGTQTNWSNAATGNRGSVRVLDEHEDYGTTCRHIRMRNEVRGRTGGGIFRLCLSANGSWTFAPNGPNAPSN